MLIEELFSTGIMKMGPSSVDPTRQVGVFNPEFVSCLPALRSTKMEDFRWLVGEWGYENAVPASSASPAYGDIGSARFSLCEKSGWICMVAPDGSETQNITFDPFGKQWIYVLTKGSYGILRSKEGWVGTHIAFIGLMTMIGINREWRMTWAREDDAHFSFTNEERNADGSWAFIDEWHFTRKGR